MASHPTDIRALHVALLDIPLFEPFGISGGAQAAANNVLVTLELADGTLGYGWRDTRVETGGGRRRTFAGVAARGAVRRSVRLKWPCSTRSRNSAASRW